MKISLPNSRGFSLVEVVIAIGILSFCLLAIFGLLPVGLSSNKASVEQSGAANIATAIVADLRATPKPPSNPESPQYGLNIPPSSAASYTLFFRKDGKIANTNPSSDPFYRAYVDIKEDAQSPATVVRFLITWPALGDTGSGPAPKNFTGSFETVVALDRS